RRTSSAWPKHGWGRQPSPNIFQKRILSPHTRTTSSFFKNMASIEPLLIKTHSASAGLRRASGQQLQDGLSALADSLLGEQATLLKANARDLSAQAPDNPRNDRLLLNEQRIRGIAEAIRKVAALPDPSGRVLEDRLLPNGLRVEKMAVPLGVVGAIYESR